MVEFNDIEMPDEILINKYKGAIYKISCNVAKTMNAFNYLDDLIQEATIILLDLKNKYNPEYDCKFLSYFMTYGRLQLIEEILTNL